MEMSDDTERTSTGIVGFDAHLQGGYPKGKIILEGPSSEERNTFALSFAAEGLREEDFVVVVTSSISPTKVRKELRKLGIDVKSFERKGHLVIINWYSHSDSEVFEIEEIGAVIKCPGDALHLNEAFSKAISRFPREGRTRAVIDGLSALIGEYDMNSALLLANSIVSVLGRDKSTALFVIDSEMHDSATVYQLQKSFDGHIKLNRTKGEGAVVGEISVRSFKNTETPSKNLVLERSEDWALRIRSDAEPREEELDEEISDLMGSLKKDSENAVTWFELGTHYASEGEYRKAHECFDTAIKLQPNYLAAWTSKANMYIDEGENDEAVQCYRKALRLQTDSEEILEEPEEEVEPSVRPCPECGTEVSSVDPFCLECGADMPPEPSVSDSKPVDEVLAMCEEKLRKDPADVDAWFVKGLCLARLGRYQESVNALNETTRLDVEYPGLWLIKGKVYARLGDEKKADLSLRRGMDFARKDSDRVGATFECSICGENVELSADQCSNCGASFKSEVRKVSLPETEEDLFSFPEDVTLDDVLKRWESELTDLITPEEEPPEKPEFVREIGRVKKRVVEGERDLTGRPVERLREAKLSRREGLTNGIGRTNGLTNGLVNGIRRKPKGRVNGLRGRTNGLTNGLRGRTNGLTNGLRGRTNGLTNGLRGRTNGLTNGVRGRTNGLTNGLTNGVRGRTNGLTNGLVNGLGRASGVTNGLVNGLSSLKFSLADGLTNGNGLTNGLGVRRFSREMRLARWKVFLIPLLAVVLLTVPLFVVTSPSTGDMITIDGQFNDWNRQLVTQMNPSGIIDPNVDITQASVVKSSSRIFFYVEVLGYMLQGSTPMGIGDVVQIFIDSDREYQTGYQLRGLGADYMVEVFGISNGVRASVLKEYSLTGSENDWNRWTSKGKVNAAVGLSEMEVSVGLRSLGDDVTSVLALFHTLSWDGDQDFSDLVLSESGGVLSILQRSAIASDTLTGLDQNLLNIELYAYNRDVTISSLQVDILGSVQSSEISSLKLISEQSQLLDQTIYSQNPATFAFDSIVIPKDSSISLDVRADIVGNTGSTVGAVIPSSSSIGLGEDAATVSYISSIRDLGYVGQIPSQITIDGGFIDWVNCTNSDDTGEQSLKGDSNIDIACYDDATGGNSLFVYYDVLGRIMAGTNVPSRSPTLRQQVSSPVVDSDRDTVPDEHDSNVYDFNNDGISDGQTPYDLDYDSILDYPQGMDYWLNTTIPMSFPPPYAGRNVSIYIGPVERPVVVGEDVARIYVDADNSTTTGYAGVDVGAEYLLEVRGINGMISNAGLFEFAGRFPGEWKWNESGVSVDVALDSRQMEMSVDTSLLQLQPDYVLEVETENWRNGNDNAGGTTMRGTKGKEDSSKFILFLENSEGVDLQLQVLSEDGYYAYASLEGLLDTYFTSRSGEQNQVRIQTGDLAITWQMMSVGHSTGNHYVSMTDVDDSVGSVEHNRIRYVDIVQGLSDEYEVEWNRVKHDILVNSESAIADIPNSATFLSFEGLLTLSDSSEVWIDGTRIGSHFSTQSIIRITNEGGDSVYLQPPFAYEENDYSEKTYGRFSGTVSESTVRLITDIPLVWLRSERRQYPIVIDPTVTVNTTNESEPTSYSNQRKVFYDGSYYWAFWYNYSDGVAPSNTFYEYSADGQDWSGLEQEAFTSNNVHVASVWYHDTGSEKIVYIASGGLSSSNVIVRRGTISGTSITWGSEYAATVCAKSQAVKVAFISRSSDGYIWVISGGKESPSSPSYNIAAVRSTNTDDVSAWDAYTTLLSANTDGFYLYPIVLPLSGGDMYAIWYADGEIAGKKYTSGTGWSGSVDSIETTTGSVTNKTPSAVVDSSSNIHLVYSNSSGAVNYTKYTTSWGSPTVLDSLDGGAYPTISLESTNDYLYAFWVNSSNQVWGSKWEGSSWSNITNIDANTTAKKHLTSIYSTPNKWNICWECGMGTDMPYLVSFFCIPEFDSLVVPLSLAIVAPILLRWKSKTRRRKKISY
ncbi:MAG: tetratricopeptide repeat protein [Methanomassiliicoccales archaeon]|nr:MAG: tetratricopeptide repeat protein [Methanomassiliicoccales archaeon]